MARVNMEEAKIAKEMDELMEGKTKVFLKDIVIGKSALTDNVYAGVVDKSKQWFKHKIDVTGYFIKAIVDWLEEGKFSQTIRNTNNGKSYELFLIEKKENYEEVEKKIKQLIKGE